MKNERYYFSLLPEDEKEAYKVIFNGIKMRAANIVVSEKLHPDVVHELYLKVLYDNPLFFYVNQRVINITTSRGRNILWPEYLYSKDEITYITNEIRKVVNTVVANAEEFKDNLFRLEKYLHDSVVKSVAYDYDSLLVDDCYNAHSIVGAFLDNKAVCEGIAKAFKLLCNEFGIKCIIVIGKADDDGDFNKRTYHAWNIVKIGDDSYHVDVTWDNLYDKEIRHISYDYFNLPTEEIMLDHLPMVDIPKCNSTKLNYFYGTNSFVTTYMDLVNLIEERFDSNEIMFKASKNRSEFQRPDELKEKTLTAVLHVMHKRNTPKNFHLLFNEMHNIGKILFVVEEQTKIDLRKDTSQNNDNKDLV